MRPTVVISYMNYSEELLFGNLSGQVFNKYENSLRPGYWTEFSAYLEAESILDLRAIIIGLKFDAVKLIKDVQGNP